MELQSLVNLFVVVFTTICVTFVCASSDKISTFNVIPGGSTLTYKDSWEKGTCEFTYVCQGGTKEEWVMKMMPGQNGELVCHIMRPDGNSYLFFQSFEVKITGYRLSSARVFTSKTDLADSAEYFVDKQKGVVKSTSSFSAALNSILVTALKDKEEL